MTRLSKLFLVLIILSTGLSAANNWPMFSHDPAHTGHNTGSGPLTNQTLWSYVIKPYLDVSSSPVVIDGVVYIGGYEDDYVYALNASTGQLIWKHNVVEYANSPVVVDGVVYIGSNGDYVYALNASTGEEIWNYYRTYGDVESPPVVVDGVVYVGSEGGIEGGFIYALDASTGDLIWKYQTSGLVKSSPAVVDGVVYIGSGDGKFYALNASTGDLIWMHLASSSWARWSSPAVVDGVVYAGSEDDYVYALDAGTGDLIWKYKTGKGVFSSSPAVVDGVVYVGSRDHNVYALNASTGKKIWNYTTGEDVVSSPAVVGSVVYVGSSDGKVYALDAGTGDVIWKYAIGYKVISSPAVVDGVLYVGSWDGKVYAIGVPSEQQGGQPEQEQPEESGGETQPSQPSQELSLELLWAKKVPKVVSGDVVVAQGKLFFTYKYDDFKRNVYAWNANTGGSLWTSKALPSVDCLAYYPEQNNLLAYGTKLYTLDLNTGAVTWAEEDSHSSGSGILIAENKAFVTTNEGILVYDLSTPKLKSLIRFSSLQSRAPEAILVHSGDKNVIVVSGVGANADSVVGFDASSETKTWQFTVSGHYATKPLSDDYGNIYFGDDSGNMYCLNAVDGSLVWKSSSGELKMSASDLDEKQVYFYSSKGGAVYAVDKVTGNLVWKTGMQSIQSLIRLENNHMIGLGIRSVILMNTEDGTIEKKYSSLEYKGKEYPLYDFVSSPVFDNNVIYVAPWDYSDVYYFYAIKIGQQEQEQEEQQEESEEKTGLPPSKFSDVCGNGRGWSIPSMSERPNSHCITVDCCNWYRRSHVHDVGALLGSGRLVVEVAPGSFKGCEDKVTVSVSSDGVGWNSVGSFEVTSKREENSWNWVKYSHSFDVSTPFRYVKVNVPHCYNDWSGVSVENAEEYSGDVQASAGEWEFYDPFDDTSNWGHGYYQTGLQVKTVDGESCLYINDDTRYDDFAMARDFPYGYNDSFTIEARAKVPYVGGSIFVAWNANARIATAWAAANGVDTSEWHVYRMVYDGETHTAQYYVDGKYLMSRKLSPRNFDTPERRIALKDKIFVMYSHLAGKMTGCLDYIAWKGEKAIPAQQQEWNASTEETSAGGKVSVFRDLPEAYRIREELEGTITIKPEEGVNGLIVYENIPLTLQVVSVFPEPSEKTVGEGFTTLKWVFFDKNGLGEKKITYALKPVEGATNEGIEGSRFSGTWKTGASFDMIQGDDHVGVLQEAGEISDEDVLKAIDKWAAGGMSDEDLLDLISRWGA